ncbi:MAG: hypothetical protein GPJ52_02200 [Candidatus Heimdallarchaeota archaeon]|nr:hypothetical protein [Candidatus Heimdallarchaeota archaeon]
MQTIDDYWVNATYGLMSIDWVVEGWYDLGHNLAHYGHLNAWNSLVFDINWHDLVDDAIDLADGDINFANYDNLIIILGDIWWRGVSTLGTQVNIDTDEGNFNKEATVVGEQDTDPIEVVWGRIAHEMGHCFLLRHTHGSGGTPDLMINEWGNPPGSPGPYESIDIHIDSPVNGWNWYRHNDGNGNNPVGNGDDPLLNHANRLHAKINNIGDADASGVIVRFYENTPIGAGASGSWSLIDTVTGLTVVKGTTQDIYVDWTPTHSVSPTDSGIMDMHSCVKVVIEDHILEDNTGNNDAQENIDFFEVVSGSPMPGYMNAEASYGSVSKEFTIVNPWKEAKEIHINVLGVTNDWIVTGNGIGEFHNFSANEAKVFNIVITPGPDARITDTVQADLVASTNVIYDEGDETFVGDMHLTPFGGVTLTATIMYRSSLNIDATIRDENFFTIIGELSFLEDVPQQHLPQAEGDRTVYII